MDKKNAQKKHPQKKFLTEMISASVEEPFKTLNEKSLKGKKLESLVFDVKKLQRKYVTTLKVIGGKLGLGTRGRPRVVPNHYSSLDRL